MLADVVGCLECPHCAAGMAMEARTLTCETGHSFDIARQGYVSLLRADAQTGTADTTAMVEARSAFLESGHYAQVGDLIAGIVASALVAGPDGCVVDVGAGTGHYLSRVLDAVPGRVGVALDVSKSALRRAARAHPRMGAVACDVWRPLPLRTASAAAILDVFAPRNPAEFQRVLVPGGLLVVVTPAQDHLAELVGPLGLVTVDPRKDERLDKALGGLFAKREEVHVGITMSLTRSEVETVIGMGPSARHVDPSSIARALSAIEEPVRVTASLDVSVYESRGVA